MKSLHTYIDHTLLDPKATQKDIARLCMEAIEHQFYAVCVHGKYTAFAKAQLQDTAIKIATVVGFPLGTSTSISKAFESQEAIQLGANEIDMVLNISALKDGDLDAVALDIMAVRNATQGHILKVIFENCYLTDAEKRIACRLCMNADVDYIKTSTGFGTGGATIDDVRLMKEELDNRLKIKASGGIRDKKTALQYIHLGADRIGTSSGINIIT